MRWVAAICVVALAGCGGDRSEALPAACTEGPGAVVKALENAPGSVAIDGTRISECFNRDAPGEDVQIVGTGLIAAAQQLGDQAAANPDAALRLGYLIGAARRGLKRNGVAAEMVRRLEGETGRLGANAAAYKRGLRAGLAQG